MQKIFNKELDNFFSNGHRIGASVAASLGDPDPMLVLDLFSAF